MKLHAPIIWLILCFQVLASEYDIKTSKCLECNEISFLTSINDNVIEILQNIKDENNSKAEEQKLADLLTQLKEHFPNLPKPKPITNFEKFKNLLKKFIRRKDSSPSTTMGGEPKTPKQVFYEITDITAQYILNSKEHTGSQCKFNTVQTKEANEFMDIAESETFFKAKTYKDTYEIAINSFKKTILQKKLIANTLTQILSILDAIPTHYKCEKYYNYYQNIEEAINYAKKSIDKIFKIALIHQRAGHILKECEEIRILTEKNNNPGYDIDEILKELDKMAFHKPL